MQANCKSVLSHQFVDFYCNVIVDYFIQHVKFATAISGVEIFIQHAWANAASHSHFKLGIVDYVRFNNMIKLMH